MNKEKNTNGQVYCKAVIGNKTTKFFYIMCILLALSVIISALILIPVRGYETNRFWGSYTWHNNIFGDKAWKESSGGSWEFLADSEITVMIIIDALFILIIIAYLLIRYSAKKCMLELNKDGVFGNKKTPFATRSISLPFEKVDSAYVKNGFFDKCFGGETIVISSASSRIKFICVLNAEEFVDQTLAELKKFKKSVSSSGEDPKDEATSSSQSSMDDLLKLKTLLDQGLITQEEFDEKRKSIVNKI